MREIKFRVWDVKNKKMITFEAEEADNFLMCPFTNALYDHSARLYRRAFERLQYTGLKDKNGKEIYEGDIVSAYGIDARFKIEWEPLRAGWFAVSEDNSYGISSGFAFRAEVIGNIYENQGSLEVKHG